MSSASKIKLADFDDLFGSDQTEVTEVPLEELYPFKGHPFKVMDNEDMQSLVDSIRLHGRVLQPGLVRMRPEGGYELISGHRRCHASKIAGLSTMPVIIRDLTDDEATVIMVDSNIQREHLLYSEKAFAYKMKFEALKHPGSKMDKQAIEEIGEEAGESGRNIQRYIRLTELLPELLNLVDEGKLGFVAAVDLSFLKSVEQEWVCDKLSQGISVGGSQAAKLKKYSASGELNLGMVDLILTEEKPQKQKFVLKQDKLRQYFPQNYSSEQIEETILDLLEKWKNNERS